MARVTPCAMHEGGTAKSRVTGWVGLGGTLKDHPAPTPCQGQGHPPPPDQVYSDMPGSWHVYFKQRSERSDS